MKRVVILSNQAFSLVNFRGSLIKELTHSGHEVIAMAPDISPALQNELMKLGAKSEHIPLSRTGLNPWIDFTNMVFLAFRLRNIKPDILLSYSIKPVIFGVLAAWIVRVPLRVALIEGLGYVFTPTTEKMSLMRRTLGILVRCLYWIALKGAHTVIFLNRDDAQEFINGYLVSESKVVVLGGIGVDLDEWAYTPVPFGEICFIMVARLLREKGVNEYLAAAKLVKAQYPSARFVLLGALDINPGALRIEEIKQWVDAGVLEWPGHVDVKMWLKKSSVFVLPSYREGIPRSTQEAMSIGRAVISTNVPGCRETVEEGVNGFLVPARNTTALAQSMLRFVESPALIEAMGIESRRLALERFDVNKVNRRLFTIFGLV